MQYSEKMNAWLDCPRPQKCIWKIGKQAVVHGKTNPAPFWHENNRPTRVRSRSFYSAATSRLQLPQCRCAQHHGWMHMQPGTSDSILPKWSIFADEMYLNICVELVVENRSTFDEDVREKRFLHFRSQWPWPWSDLTQNLNRSSHGQSTPSLKISCKSVQPFSHNVANKETKKRKKSSENNTTSPQGRGKNYIFTYLDNHKTAVTGAVLLVWHLHLPHCW